MEPKQKKPDTPAPVQSVPVRSAISNAKRKEPCIGQTAVKKAVFVVDDCDLEMADTTLRFCLEGTGAEIRVLPFSTFLSSPSCVFSDALVVKSSMGFVHSAESRQKLASALEGYRANNPDAAIIVVACGYSENLAKIVPNGIIDLLERDIKVADESLFIDKAAGILATRGK